MKLGVLSDSHGRATRIETALTLLERLGAEMFIHCGDVGEENALAALASRNVRFVWGNTDFADAGMIRYAQRIGLTPPTRVPTLVEADNRVVAVFHGHEPQFEQLARLATGDGFEAFGAAARKRGYDAVLFGHTHQPMTVNAAGVRLLNPGALHRAATYTVATLDLATDEARHWRLVDQQSEWAEPVEYFPGRE